MRRIHELTPSQQVLEMYLSWHKKDSTCLDSTLRNREGWGKEGGSRFMTFGFLEDKVAKNKDDAGI